MVRPKWSAKWNGDVICIQILLKLRTLFPVGNLLTTRPNMLWLQLQQVQVAWLVAIAYTIYYHSMHSISFSLAESPPRDLRITDYKYFC